MLLALRSLWEAQSVVVSVVVPAPPSGGYGFGIAAIGQQRRTAEQIRRQRIKLGILEDDEEIARRAAVASHQAQEERQNIELAYLSLQHEIAAQEASRADRAHRALDEAQTLRQRRRQKQHTAAANRSIEALHVELQDIAAREAALAVEIEELDVVFVAAMMLAA